jgi:hypothetical protein
MICATPICGLSLPVPGRYTLNVDEKLKRRTIRLRRADTDPIEALLVEFDYEVDTSLMCRMMRALCYYVEDIECTDGCHDQAACTRDAFITRYLTRPHGCRDPRPEYQKRYL